MRCCRITLSPACANPLCHVQVTLNAQETSCTRAHYISGGISSSSVDPVRLAFFFSSLVVAPSIASRARNLFAMLITIKRSHDQFRPVSSRRLTSAGAEEDGTGRQPQGEQWLTGESDVGGAETPTQRGRDAWLVERAPEDEGHVAAVDDARRDEAAASKQGGRSVVGSREGCLIWCGVRCDEGDAIGELGGRARHVEFIHEPVRMQKPVRTSVAKSAQ